MVDEKTRRPTEEQTNSSERRRMSDVTTKPADRGSVEHRVKSWPPLFAAILSGDKTHELRRVSDRDYQMGDILLLQEFDPITQKYSGREIWVKITYITSAEFPCALSESALDPEFCILSIKKV